MEKPIIEVKNLSKKYLINHERGKYVALRDVISGYFRNPFGFIRSKVRAAAGLEKKEEFWALSDVNFSVKKGEVVGVIGHNGAGKSTLLKIISQITPPSDGEIIIRGRVGSLLEVGTGFHPELSGRENIFLNGAILGMKRVEIAEKFDQIVAFAGIEKFLDTPVKYYSSGMYVRLAFSVAAHMEPDVLLVDEVLAVGDAEFQKKCLGKMDEITKKEGRTILFVSHNLAAIRQLCKKTIVLGQGKIAFSGDTDKAIEFYMRNAPEQTNHEDLSDKKREERARRNVLFTKISFHGASGETMNRAQCGQPLIVSLAYKSKTNTTLENCRASISFKTTYDELLFLCATDLVNKDRFDLAPEGEIKCRIDSLPLPKGRYMISIFFQVNNQIEDWIEEVAVIDVENGDFFGTGSAQTYLEGSSVLVKHKWLL